MLEYITKGFKNFSVQYSPFIDSRIAVASGANFGLVGNGRLYILNLTTQGIACEKWFDTQDVLYSLSWSEAHSNQLVTASGDGSVKLFDTGVDTYPIAQWQEHSREVFSVHWNLVSKETFCSSSWDGCIKIYNPNRDTSLLTLPTHACTYSALYSPHSPSIMSAVSSDSQLRVFDLRTPPSAANHLTLCTPIHAPMQSSISNQQSIPTYPPSEALTHDWNRYRDTVIATAGVDRVIRIFDLRMLSASKGPVAAMAGHEYAVRNVKWSPHLSNILLSGSYDMSVRAWSDGSSSSPSTAGGGGGPPGPETGLPGFGEEPKELGRMLRHTEFVTGVDWCLFGAEGWCASVGWDERLLVWDVRAVMGHYGSI